MAIFKDRVKIKTNDIDSQIKKSEKRNKRSSNLFGSTKEQEKRYQSLPGLRGKSDKEKEKSNKEIKNIDMMDNNDSLKEALSGLNESNEESLELEKTSVMSRNPLKLLSDMNDKRKQFEAILEDKAFEAGKLSAIFDGIRKLFQKQAKRYVKEHRNDNSSEEVAKTILSVKEIAGKVGSDVLQAILKNKKGDSTAQKGLETVFKKAFDYLTFKAACFIANEDVPEIKDAILDKAAELTGANSNIYPTDMIGGQKDHAQGVFYKVYKEHMSEMKGMSNEAFSILTNVADYATYERNAGIFNFNDVMEFYEALYKGNESDEKGKYALDYITGGNSESKGLELIGMPIYTYNGMVTKNILGNIQILDLPESVRKYRSYNFDYLPLDIKCPPVNGTKSPCITSHFGQRTDPYAIKKGMNATTQFHNGIDIADRVSIKNATVSCIADGIVVRACYSKTYGKYVLVDHENGYLSLYAHMDDLSVTKGKKVNAGNALGIVGNTGASTGYHLHFSIMQMTPDQYKVNKDKIKQGLHNAIALYRPVDPEIFPIIKNKYN